MKDWFIRDRRNDPVTSYREGPVDTNDWPFVICKPSPPWAFGEVVALAIIREDAEMIIKAINKGEL